MPVPIKESVVVITGASSGIGRATALAFAEKGARLVLAARREQALMEVATACHERGAEAVVVPTDVTDPAQVEQLAERAYSAFGGIDTWVNNAAVTLFARFGEEPLSVYKRVMDTNFFGYVHGARAALARFREQGAGVLINVASVVSRAGQPYTSAYVASKFAIRGWAECLRMELALDDDHDIHVCTVLPAVIDTPLFQQAANYTGRRVKAMDPVYTAEGVADTIVAVAKKPEREMVAGGAGKMMSLQHTLAPSAYEKTMAQQVDKDHLGEEPAPATQGNLFEPMPEYAAVSGGWTVKSGSNGTLKKVAVAGFAAAVPAGIYLATRRSP